MHNINWLPVSKKRWAVYIKERNVYCTSLYTFPIQCFSLLLEGQKHKDSKLGIEINVSKGSKSHLFKHSQNKLMHVQTVFVDTSWLHNEWKMFLIFITFTFLWKNGVSGKIKAHLLRTPKHYNNLSALTFLFLFKKCLASPPFKKEGRDYAFCMRDYKRETRKLFPFYMTDILFTEL